MPERARTDLWEPRGSNPPGPPGPEHHGVIRVLAKANRAERLVRRLKRVHEKKSPDLGRATVSFVWFLREGLPSQQVNVRSRARDVR